VVVLKRPTHADEIEGRALADMTESEITSGLDIREKIAHIDQMLADHDRKRQEIRYAPFLATISGLTAGAALFAAGAAFMKVFG
jgi:hypothetical protein